MPLYHDSTQRDKGARDAYLNNKHTPNEYAPNEKLQLRRNKVPRPLAVGPFWHSWRWLEIFKSARKVQQLWVGNHHLLRGYTQTAAPKCLLDNFLNAKAPFAQTSIIYSDCTSHFQWQQCGNLWN